MTTCTCWVPREGVLNSCESNLCLTEDTTGHESTQQQRSNKTVSKIDPQFYLFIWGEWGVFFFISAKTPFCDPYLISVLLPVGHPHKHKQILHQHPSLATY